MFSKLRRRVTYANVGMTVAILFAMAGGAYAAKKVIITSKSQIAKSVIKELKGAKGPAGPAGPAGPTGPAGEKGGQGPAGKDGVNGGVGPAGATGPKGTTGLTGATGSTGVTGVTGKEGTTGPEGVCSTSSCHLPSGVTETGQWSVVAKTDEGGVGTAISFNVPLAASLEASNTHFIGEHEGEGETKPAAAITNNECKGTYLAPAAASKQLCVFVKEISKYELFFTPIASLAGGSVGADTTGAQLLFIPSKYTEEFVGNGSWAVTAE